MGRRPRHYAVKVAIAAKAEEAERREIERIKRAAQQAAVQTAEYVAVKGLKPGMAVVNIHTRQSAVIEDIRGQAVHLRGERKTFHPMVLQPVQAGEAIAV